MKRSSFSALCSWGITSALLGLALFLARLVLGGVHLGLPLDDAWIHCAFASHLARFHQWGLFAGIHSGGESSVLWPFLLSPAELRAWSGAPRLALILGALSFLPLPALLGSFASTPARARVLAGASGLFGPLLFLALSGMETMTALTLSVAAIYCFSRERLRAAALWAAVAVFVRPDALLLLMVFALWRRWRPLLPGLLVAISALFLLALLDGHFPPATLGGRRWLLGLPPGLELYALGRGTMALMREWVHAMGGDLGLGRVFSAHPSAGFLVLRTLWKIAFVSVLAGGALVLLPRRSEMGSPREELSGEESSGAGFPRGARVLLLWTLATLLFYALVLPTRGHAGRYQPQLYLLLLLLGVEGLGWMWHWRDWRRGFAMAAAVLLGAGFLAGSVEISGLFKDAVAHINRVHLRAALDLNGLLPPGSRLAVFDVGAAAYSYKGEMLDLSGLSDPALTRLLPLAEKGVVELWLRERGATHLLLPVLNEGAPDGLDRRLGLRPSSGLRLLEQHRWRGRRDEWARAFQFSGNAFPELVLYRMEWTR